MPTRLKTFVAAIFLACTLVSRPAPVSAVNGCPGSQQPSTIGLVNGHYNGNYNGAIYGWTYGNPQNITVAANSGRHIRSILFIYANGNSATYNFAAHTQYGYGTWISDPYRLLSYSRTCTDVN